MKLTPYIKKGLRILVRDAGILGISFIILPMALGLIYGNMQKDSFEGKNPSIKAVKVDFIYNDTTPRGSIFKSILSQKEVGSFISVVKEKPDYSVRISNDFKSVEIKGKEEGSEQFIILKNFITAIVNNFNQYEAMQSAIMGLNLNENEKKDLINNVLGSLTKNEQRVTISEKIIEGYRTINSTEYYTISMFSFTSVIMLLSLAGYFYKEVKEGILKRSLSTPTNKRTYFLGFLFSTFIVSFAVSAIYVVINRIRGAAFLENPFELLLVILLQSLLSTSVVGAVIAFIKKEVTANALMSALFIIPSVFGGVFFYSETIGLKIMKTLMNNVPNVLILNSYKGLAITGNLSGIQGELMAMSMLSIALIAISLIKIELKWEV